MNSVEDRARTALQQLVDPVESLLAVEDILRSGERRRRQRRATLLASGAAGFAMVVASVVLLAGLPSRSPIMATPAPSTAMPTAPASSGATEPSVAPHHVRMNPGTDSEAWRNGITAVDGTAQQVSGVWELTFDVDTRLGETIHRTARLEPGARVPAVLEFNDRFWVVVAADTLTWIYPTQDSEGTADMETYPYNSVPLTAYAMAGATSALSGFVWRDTNGAFWDDQGESVPHAEFAVGGKRQWFAQDSRLSLACGGEGDPGSDLEYMTGCSAFDATETKAVIKDTWGTGSDAESTGFAFGVLPAGAGHLKVKFAMSGCESATAQLGEGGPLAFVLRCPDEDSGIFAAIHYTDAAGKQVTVRP